MQDWEFWQRNFVFTILLQQRVGTHVILSLFSTSHCVYVFVVLDDMWKFKTGHLSKNDCVYFSVVVEGTYTCKLGSLATSLCFYGCVVVEVMYTCHTDNFGIDTFCLCLCCFIGYVHI